MATILEFRQDARLSQSHHRSAGAQAEIVFFPGVRYERWDQTPAAAAPKKRIRRRDRIQLDD